MVHRLRPARAALVALLLAGCTRDGGGGYPSLAPRAIERQSFAEPSRPAAPLIADPVLDAQVGSHSAELATLAAGFDKAASGADTRKATARGRPAGSDPWLAAQAALAGLDDWRARTTALAATIEALAAARAAALQPPYPTLQALSERAAAETARQGTATERLQAALPAA